MFVLLYVPILTDTNLGGRIGLLDRDKLIIGEGGQDQDIESWQPTHVELDLMNQRLEASGGKKRFGVKQAVPVPASSQLGRIVVSVVGDTVERLPSSASTIFSSLVRVLGVGRNMPATVLARWLTVALEALWCQSMRLTLVPESSTKAMFRKKGHFIEVRVEGSCTASVLFCLCVSLPNRHLFAFTTGVGLCQLLRMGRGLG